MDELKPCPFCGRSVTVYYSSATNGYYFVHRSGDRGCILLTPSTIVGKYKNLTEAYNAWNRRPSHE